MTRFCWWALTVTMGAALGTLIGSVLGELLYRFSYDYVFVPAEIERWGLRVGALGGALIAAVQVAGPAAPASPRIALVAFVLVLAAGSAGCAIGAASGYVAYKLGWLPAQAWGLPNPTRHAMSLGVMAGKDLGVALGLAWALVIVARTRGASGTAARRWGTLCGLVLVAVIGGCEPTLVPMVGSMPKTMQVQDKSSCGLSRPAKRMVKSGPKRSDSVHSTACVHPGVKR